MFRLFMLLRTHMVYHFLMVPIINQMMGYVFSMYFRMISLSFVLENIEYKSNFELLLWFIPIYWFLNEERNVEILDMPTDRSVWIFPHLANFPLRICWNSNPEMESKEREQLSALFLVIKQSRSHLVWLYWVGIFPVADTLSQRCPWKIKIFSMHNCQVSLCLSPHLQHNFLVTNSCPMYVCYWLYRNFNKKIDDVTLKVSTPSIFKNSLIFFLIN